MRLVRCCHQARPAFLQLMVLTGGLRGKLPCPLWYISLILVHRITLVLGVSHEISLVLKNSCELASTKRGGSAKVRFSTRKLHTINIYPVHRKCQRENAAHGTFACNTGWIHKLALGPSLLTTSYTIIVANQCIKNSHISTFMLWYLRKARLCDATVRTYITATQRDRQSSCCCSRRTGHCLA